MARYTKVLKSLSHNAVGNRRIGAVAGNNYYVTGAALGDAPNYTLSLSRSGGLGNVTVNLGAIATDSTKFLSSMTYSPSTYKITGTMSDSSTVILGDSLTLFGESISLSGTNNGRVNLYEESSNGNAYVSLRAPPDMGTDPSYYLTLPTTNGGSGQYLISDGLGVLSWSTPTDANYVTTAATFGADGILTGTVGGGGSNWTGDFNAGLHMSSSTANKPHISLTNTTDDNSAPLLDFIKDRDGTAAVSDDLGGIRFYGDDAGGAQHNLHVLM